MKNINPGLCNLSKTSVNEIPFDDWYFISEDVFFSKDKNHSIISYLVAFFVVKICPVLPFTGYNSNLEGGIRQWRRIIAEWFSCVWNFMSSLGDTKLTEVGQENVSC